MAAQTGFERAARRLLADDVRDRLLTAIHSGELRVGERLPAEPELCDSFGVSRVTIREAVRSLVEGGYLNRVHGSGTYVAFQPSVRHTLERNLSYSKMIESAGMTPGLTVLGVRRGPATEPEARHLRLSGGDEVVRVERVRSADDTPAVLSIDTLPAELLGETPDDGLRGSLYLLLESLGAEVAQGEATLVPVLATSEHARKLGVERHSPLTHIRQHDWTVDGQPAMYSLEWHVPGVLELTLLRRPR